MSDSEDTNQTAVAKTTDQTQTSAEVSMLKQAGQLFQPHLNLMVVIHVNNPHFTGTKDKLSSVPIGDNTLNFYSPFKKAKKEGQVPGAFREIIQNLITSADFLNSSKILVLGKEKASPTAAINKVFAAVASEAQSTFQVEELWKSDEGVISTRELFNVGTWSNSEKSTTIPVVDQEGFVCVSIQVPELYDSEAKSSSVSKIVSFLEHAIAAEPDLNVMFALSMGANMLSTDEGREFFNELHESFAFFTRQDLLKAQESWMPTTRKDVETYVLPPESDFLFVTLIGDTEESTDE